MKLLISGAVALALAWWIVPILTQAQQIGACQKNTPANSQMRIDCLGYAHGLHRDENYHWSVNQ